VLFDHFNTTISLKDVIVTAMDFVTDANGKAL
jgi:hypothetical protein